MADLNEAEIKLQAEFMAQRTLLTPDDAEYLITFTNGDVELLKQCEVLANNGVTNKYTITEWLQVKMNLISFQPPGFSVCEGVLKRMGGDHT